MRTSNEQIRFSLKKSYLSESGLKEKLYKNFKFLLCEIFAENVCKKSFKVCSYSIFYQIF